MPIQTVIQSDVGFRWLDLVRPTPEELAQVARECGLHPTSVQDCLRPEHLPKYERTGPVNFVIFRTHDAQCSREADSVQELTRKVAIFYSDRFLITIHRVEQRFLTDLNQRWSLQSNLREHPLQQILTAILSGVVESYEGPLEEASNQLEELEAAVFEAQGAKPFNLKQGYFLKRRASVYRRMLKGSMEVFSKIPAGAEVDVHELQSLKEWAEELYIDADDLVDGANSLLNLHLSIASHRTNEVMRVLTIFSMFILPLNVITGIYGMNFERMPELKWTGGYPAALLLMVAVFAAVYIW
ncbi:magnesium transporter CorA, partial [bacterium]|nr:magnesium transporter CorA [bacterium]